MPSNQVQVRMSVEDAEAVRAWQESKRGLQEFTQELEKAGNKGKKATEDVSAGLSDMVGKAATAATAIMLIKRAIDTAGEAWTDYLQRQKDALESAKNVDQSSRKLSQLAAGDPQKLQALHAQRDMLAVKYGIDRGQVSEALYTAQSAGLTDEELETALKGSLIGDDAAGATKLMGQVKQITKGKMDARQAYNIGLQAAIDATNLEASDVTAGMPELLNPAEVLGLGFADTAAIFSETSAHYSSGSETATAYKRLLSKLSMDKRYAGRGLAGLEEFVNLPEERWEDVIGKDSEPRAAARNLRDEFADIKRTSGRYKDVAAATGTADDLLTKSVDTHLSDDENAAVHRINQKTQELEVAKEANFAAREGGRQAAVLDTQTRTEKEQPGFSLQGFARKKAVDIAKWAGGSEEYIRRVGGEQHTAFEETRYWLNKGLSLAMPTQSGNKVISDYEAKQARMDEYAKNGEKMVDILERIEKNTANKNVRVESGGDGSKLPGQAAPGLSDAHHLMPR